MDPRQRIERSVRRSVEPALRFERPSKVAGVGPAQERRRRANFIESCAAEDKAARKADTLDALRAARRVCPRTEEYNGRLQARSSVVRHTLTWWGSLSSPIAIHR